MVKILFVCHGNICRSPMAEFIMKDLVKRSGAEDKFEIKSAAVSAEEVGNGVYPPAKKVLKSHGISCDGKTAVRIAERDFEYYDLIIAMDFSNIANMKRFVGNEMLEKVSLLMDYTKNPGEVADPWYTGDFEKTYDDIFLGCNGLMKHLLKSGRI